jgi:CheY-like chemotaxis protein
VNLEDNHTIIQLKVSDTGIGIKKEQQQEIFTRFHRLSPASKGVYSGLGMGLAVVKQFIDDLGAEIYVDSTPNEGATFTCVIPLKQALLDDDVGIDSSLEALPVSKTKSKLSKRLATRHHSITAQTGRARILIVEDQPFAAQIVEKVLTGLACQVDVAQNGKTALEYVQKNTYDLIFMDVGLPDIDGCEVTKRVRLKERGTALHVPIIALTAHVDIENKQSCIEAGMDAVLSKPLSKEKAQDILNAFIPTQEKTLSPEAAKLLNLEGQVIDLDLGAKIMEADRETAKKMIMLLLESADSDLNLLENAHNQHDWTKIRELAHKLRGGAAYCGTPRLYQAFSYLNDYLKDGQIELAEPLYRQAIAEMHRVKTEYHS